MKKKSRQQRRNQRTKNTAIGLVFALGVALVISVVSSSGTSKVTDVTLVTHDSFVMSPELIAAFNAKSGYNLKLIKAGDAGSLTNRLILTKNSPIADAVYGIDNTFSSLATSAGIISGKFQATDYGYVCFNYDKNWFAEKKLSAPTSIDDLVLPAYKNLTVIENPKTSSTGLSFLAATIDKFGASGWKPYWSSLKSNGVKVDDGWETAYYTDFSGSSGKGSYPIVLSYGSSPADEVRANGQSQTASILDGCFRQTEYSAVLKNAHNPKGAQAVIDFLLSSEFQKTFPATMYVYPALSGTPIPASWSSFTQIPTKTYGDKLDFNAGRKGWLADWSAIFG